VPLVRQLCDTDWLRRARRGAATRQSSLTEANVKTRDFVTRAAV
jgi:hypothetical protein